MAHDSDSPEQRTAEPLIVAGVATTGRCRARPPSLRLEQGARVDVDGVAADESVLVEVYGHQGRLRGGQFHKVVRDVLKLFTLGPNRPTSDPSAELTPEIIIEVVRGAGGSASRTPAFRPLQASAG